MRGPTPLASACMAWMSLGIGCEEPAGEPEVPTLSSGSTSSLESREAKGQKAQGQKQKGQKAKGQNRHTKPKPTGPPPTIHRDNGMVYVTGSWVKLGPRPMAPLLKLDLPPQEVADDGGPGHHGEGGAARSDHGPPGQRSQRPGKPRGPIQRWTFRGGHDLEVRDVWVDAFWLDETEVTRADYTRFIVATGYRPPHVAEEWANDGWNWNGTEPPAQTLDHPVVLVSWYDATEYCAWAGRRLPTEAEWQLAALGPWGHARDYPWGDTYAGERLNHGKMDTPNFDESDGYATTSPVGSFPSGDSLYGARDMFGNAWEFTADHRVDDWRHASTANAVTKAHPEGLRQVTAPGPGLYVAVRGGSYFFDLRPNPGGERHQFLPEIRRKTSGFRCARDDERAP